jgi:hypothetical protein
MSHIANGLKQIFAMATLHFADAKCSQLYKSADATDRFSTSFHQ